MVIQLRKAGKKVGRTIHRVAYVEQLTSTIQYTIQEPEGGISDVKYIDIDETGKFRYKGMLYDFCTVYNLTPQEETSHHGWKS